uniref:Uncharacterized protein TCIL3000_11_16230 n=1 Tax=Trypanosoma congolense (strain IL3000) TaxID=1068625 RepID=G0V390_TRYCI|nr:unnamed protein product [Trypanosoma congolense IL3000]
MTSFNLLLRYLNLLLLLFIYLFIYLFSLLTYSFLLRARSRRRGARSGTSVVMEKKTNAISLQLEKALTSFFYSGHAGRARALSMGLQSPLWLWTHQITAEDERCNRELQKVANLLAWLNDSGADLSRVAVIAPSDTKRRLWEQLKIALCSGAQRQSPDGIQLPTLLALHELTAMNARDKTVHRYEAIIYLFTLVPSKQNVQIAMKQEQFIADAIMCAKGAFVLIADAGWTAPHLVTRWPQWRSLVLKLQDEKAPLSSNEGDVLPSNGCFPSLVGPRIPLCCSRHVDQRQLEYGISPIVRSCRRLCLQRYACQRETHVCMEQCHPRVTHTSCPHACQAAMPCGHECLQCCTDRCNCFEVIEKPLPCSHFVVIGLDQTSLQPIYAEVRHVFKGYCADSRLPCAVEFVTECARCLGSFSTTCCEAVRLNHTLENKTLVCAACVRFEREVRAKILGEILIQTEEAKRRMKVEVQRSAHQQRKASSQGLFLEGSRVTICDVEKVIKPLCAEMDFPGVQFVDYDAPEFYATMDGAYGTFVSRHVDIDDLSEVRNLIRLRDGKHVLVADGGVRLIRAITSGVTERAATLLLTFKGTGGEAGSQSAASSEAFEKASKMIGRSFYLTLPVPYGETTVSDKIVEAVAVDPAYPDNVVVECRIVTVIPQTDAAPGDDAPNDSTMPVKRPRSGEATKQLDWSRVSVELLKLTVPIAALEPMEGYSAGKEVLVLEPSRQVVDPHDVQLFDAVIPHTPSVNLSEAVISTVPVGTDVPFTLLGVINPPANIADRYGPCAVLRQRKRLVTVRAGLQCRNGKGGRQITRHVTCNGAENENNKRGAGDDSVVVIVPFVFTAADELLEAENSLDAAALQTLEQRVRDAVVEKSDELALRNDEEAFHRQKQMSEISEEALKQDRVAYSTPVPLPTAELLANIRVNYAKLPCASATSLRLGRQKDALAIKQQQLGLGKWIGAMQQRYQQDAEADAAYFKCLQLKESMQ